ncbi:MAG: helix-turn-helix domain-containing protein [Gammaproteobacteria bacterium]|nr:helix-turn-helix domain-containing protein [Gammaproteobacteria bacterium]
MKTVDNYLDLLKKKYEIKSDYALAKFLGISKQRITTYRRGRASFNTEFCIIVAKFLGIEPMEIIAAMYAVREKDKLAKSFWEDTYYKIAMVSYG